ncbi:MAG: DUF6502 family protein [Steroidobacteraceae bacterium]
MEHELNKALLTSVRTLMRPVARLMLRSGVTWKQFADAARAVFVDVASSEFGKRGRPTNVSRLAILTGISRRDVRRIREQNADESAPTSAVYVSPAGRVLSAWHQDADYLDAAGQPRVLPIEGPAPSFESLMREHGGDVPATALLKELLAVRAAERGADGRVRALKRHYVPLQIDPGKTLRAGSVLADLGTTVVHDLTCQRPAELRFERRASNERIDPAHLPAFREFLEREGMAFLVKIDDWLTAHQTDAPDAMRIGVGVYHIQDDEQRGRK